jgi:hypothetical protein
VDSGRAVFHQSDQSSGCNEQGGEKGKKSVKFMDDQKLPSKKRKINYMQSEQIEYGINSSVDESPFCQGESSKKMHQLVPSSGSGEKITAAAQKNRTRADKIRGICGNNRIIFVVLMKSLENGIELYKSSCFSAMYKETDPMYSNQRAMGASGENMGKR